MNAIDEVLRRRGHQSMVFGQPLYPVRPPRPVIQAPTARMTSFKMKPFVPRPVQAAKAAPIAPVQAAAATAANNGPSRRINQSTDSSGTFASAGPSAGAAKRPPSPSPAEPFSKKQKQTTITPADSSCAVCDGPLHKLKDCPVLNGPLDR